MKTGITLFVYNRPEHTKQVLNGLKKNNIDKLYIFADGLKKEEDKESVNKVRNIIDSIKWCKTEIIKSDKNKGLADSIVDGVNYVLDKHERIIVLEDDCVPSSDFVNFMNKCFDKYEDNDQVMNITGYSLPIDIPSDYQYDIYFSYRSSSWGWGTWRRAWNSFNRDQSIIEEINNSAELRKKVNRAGEDLIPMLKKQISGEIDSWAVFWSLNIIKNDGVCVNPVKSKIKNIGHDGSGVHCGSNDKHNTNLCTENVQRLNFPDKILINDKIISNYKDFFSFSLKERIKKNIIIILKKLRLYNLLSNIKDEL
ncbi:MAG: glycosyltransferase [Candidatus Mcinerneyibacterium aminivorans]|uniref:Glycosyltransferase n=1 Tax=Candidatus Mcinerneyibacterium aminivorans TaxID=2703815 RepID=A0A5D0MLB6_9BACT|nr:MAG: glycosyltransferase [Candidatus Mcinerneyibacterium aminivorans]